MYLHFHYKCLSILFQLHLPWSPLHFQKIAHILTRLQWVWCCLFDIQFPCRQVCNLICFSFFVLGFPTWCTHCFCRCRCTFSCTWRMGDRFFRDFLRRVLWIFFRTVCGQGLPQREKERELAQEARDRRVEGEKGNGGQEGGREGEGEGAGDRGEWKEKALPAASLQITIQYTPCENGSAYW